MVHLIKYSIIRKIKNFNILFWPCVFPLILGTMFYFAFGNISDADFETVHVAFVEEEAGDQIFSDFVDEIGEEDTFIHVEKMTDMEAAQKLEERKIDGIFYGAKIPYLTVSKSGMAQSILQSLLESYLNGKNTIEKVAEIHPQNLKKAADSISDYREMVQNVTPGGKTTNNNSVFFYALVGMACMYGCFVGMGSAFWLQANVTTLAARQCVSPVHKMSMILTEMFSSFVLHFLNVVILICYLRYVLRMELQGSMGEMLLVSLVGCIMGVSLGIFVCSIGKFGEGLKVGIMLGISMTASTLAGLMSPQIKYLVDQKVPFLNKMNPAALITDSFYCINVYDDPGRFKNNLVTLLVLTAVLLAATFFIVRRERYDSI